MFRNTPTDYSYWCSHLNQTTHIAQSHNHFLYIVDLDTKGYTVSRLCTQVRFPKPQISYTSDSLYPTFVVYLMTIHGQISLLVSSLNPKTFVLTPKRINRFSKNFFGLFRFVVQTYDFLFNLSSLFELSFKKRLGNYGFTTNCQPILNCFTNLRQFYWFVNKCVKSFLRRFGKNRIC